MLQKFILIIFYVLPVAALGQAAEQPYFPIAAADPGGLAISHENAVFVPSDFGNLGMDESAKCDGNFFQPVARKDTYGQPVFKEPLYLSSMVWHTGKRMGASAIGSILYMGADDAFAYA